MKINLNDAGIFGIIVGFVGAIYGAYRTKKSNEIAQKLDLSLQKLEERTPIDIRQDVIRRATQNAVEHQVRDAVAKAIEEVGESIRSDMDRMIRKDVDGVYNDLKSQVSERVGEEIANLDYEAMREGIRRKAEKKVFDEFCSVSGVGRIFGDIRRGNGVDTGDIAKILNQFTFSSDKQRALDSLLGKR